MRNKATAKVCVACGWPLDQSLRQKSKSKAIGDPLNSLDTLSDLAEFVTDATVRITCATAKGTSLGTGFFIEEKGKTYLVSNHHVIEGALETGGAITVRFSDKLNPRKDNYLAIPIGVDPLNDLALLEVAFELPKGINLLSLASMDTLKNGQQVMAIGNPHGMEFNCIAGIIANAAFRSSSVEMSKVLCSLNAAPGNSGGPVVRVADGAVIGVATAIFHPEFMQSHTICASADAIRQMIFLYNKKNNNT